MIKNLKNKISLYLSSFLFPLFSFLFSLPTLSFAQGAPSEPPKDFGEFAGIVMDLISLAIPIVIGLSLIAFLWGLTVFILNADNEEKITEGKTFMVWGVIGLFVMVSVWGIINLLTGSFGFDFIFPQLKTS